MRELTKYAVVLFVAVGLLRARAQDNSTDEPPVAGFSADSPFEHGRYEASLNSGALFSPFIATYKRPTIYYSITEVQFGYMLGGFKEAGFFRGNLEVLGEGFGSGIFEGSGSFIAGFTLWGRYNFVRPGWRIVPFAQAGAGIVSTDIDRRIVGQPFNFNLDIGLGARYFVSRCWTVNLEYRYQHISNANTGPHNIGINAQGPILGVSYLF
jgi:opacity protein-like surface antigen